MPDFKKHIVIGMVSLGLVYVFLTSILKKTVPPELLVPMIGVAAIYSLLPDVDQKGSIINRVVVFALLGAIWFVYHYFQNIMLISFILGMLAFLTLVNHRTIVHSLAFGAVVSAPFFWVHPFIALAAFAAFISHLIVDGELSFFAERDWW